MKNILMIKTLFGKTRFYRYVRGMWYQYLDEIPRRRLRRFGSHAVNLVYKTLTDANVEYWADFGTAIGMIRDAGFIRHDDDIDFSLKAGSITPVELYKTLSAGGSLAFSHAFEYRGQITEMTFLYKKIEIDFFFTFPCVDRMITLAFNPPAKYRRDFGCQWTAYGIDRRKLSGIDVIEVQHMKIPIPRNYDELLTDCYGNWRTPVAGWSNQRDYGQVPRRRFSDCATVVDARRVCEIGCVVNTDILEA